MSNRADGIVVITPSHNPPEDSGFKYNPPSGGPADTAVTRWIEDRANDLISRDLGAVARMPYDTARRAATTQAHDYVEAYVAELGTVIDLEVIRDARLKIGVDPLGGASVSSWRPIAERFGLDLEVVNDTVDPTFRFMSLDWDGQVRMDCSSPYAMANLIELKDRFDIAFGNDPDADRHGIVTRAGGLMNPNHYLAAAIFYLFTHRPEWRAEAAVGKTIVNSSSIDRVADKLGRALVEVPVGFKWFVPGLIEGALGFGGEESAGASFLRRNGKTWTTDKDGIIMGLLAVEVMARTGRDPSELYTELTRELGAPVYERIDVARYCEGESRSSQVVAEGHQRRRAGGLSDRGCAHDSPGQRRAYRRRESDHRSRLVCGASIRHGRRVQALRGELSWDRPLAAHPAGSASDHPDGVDRSHGMMWCDETRSR